jgi:hypothetical protein
MCRKLRIDRVATGRHVGDENRVALEPKETENGQI